MNIRQLAELAGILSVHALHIVESPLTLSSKSLQDLRDVSRRRQESWSLRMQAAKANWPTLRKENFDPRCPVIEEILVSEVLTRTLAGLLAAKSLQQRDQSAMRMGTLLFHEHQAARRLALRHMIQMADAQSPEVRGLDKLRRQAERWTDILLGPLTCRFALKGLAFDFARSQEFGESILPHLCTRAGGHLLAAGLRVAFPQSLEGVPSHAGLHRNMIAAILGFLPGDLFETDGGLRPLRTVRALRGMLTTDNKPPQSPNTKTAAHSVSSDAALSGGPFFHSLRRRQKP